MNKRESSNSVENGTREETIKDEGPTRVKSDEGNGTPSSGVKEGRRSSRHRDRRKSGLESSRRVAKRGRKESSSKRRDDKRRKTNHQLRLSDTNPMTRPASKRPTRASMHYDHYKSDNHTPAIPRRVFKALQLLRHEKFLRVASRYLKPRFHGQ